MSHICKRHSGLYHKSKYVIFNVNLLLLTLCIIQTSSSIAIELYSPNNFCKICMDVKSNIENPTMVVYPVYNGNGMAILACPGGGYNFLAMNQEGHDFASWFEEKGVAFAVLNYRMPNGRADIPLQDIQQAIKIMRKNASSWGFLPNKIGVIGFSAGGHLASTLATHFEKDTRPDFQILFYPVISMNDSVTHHSSRVNLLGEQPSHYLVDLYSNELHVSQRTPPAFIVFSSDDSIVNPSNSIKYNEALVSKKVPSKMLIFPTGGHGWGFSDKFKYKRQWMSELNSWLEEINRNL